MQKTTLKSLEKLIMGIKADLVKGLRGLSADMWELKEELVIQKKRVVDLEKSVKFISCGFDKLKKENESMKNQTKALKADNL